jgi:hypothetical protein
VKKFIIILFVIILILVIISAAGMAMKGKISTAGKPAVVRVEQLQRVQADLANAEYSEISALTEYQIAVVDLAYATGTLLGAAKIEWQPIVP